MEDRLGQLVDELALDELTARRRQEGSEIDQVKAENAELRQRVARLERVLEFYLGHPDWPCAVSDPWIPQNIAEEARQFMKEG